MIELDIAEAATIGTRAEQQDAAAFVRLSDAGSGALLVLTDGLGGHADGAKAAAIVVETFRERVSSGTLDSFDLRSDALDDAVHEANERIRMASTKLDDERGMGSTVVAAIVLEGRLVWISVGDSQLYVCRRGQITKLNADHSMAGVMIRNGRASDDPAVLAARSMLASALLGRKIEKIDRAETELPLARGDVVLLASDGLDVLNNETIAAVISGSAEAGAGTIAAALIGAVGELDLDRQDNATVVVARLVGDGAPASPEDALPLSVTRPDTGLGANPDQLQESSWPLALGLAFLAALAAGVILTQMP